MRACRKGMQLRGSVLLRGVSKRPSNSPATLKIPKTPCDPRDLDVRHGMLLGDAAVELDLGRWKLQGGDARAVGAAASPKQVRHMSSELTHVRSHEWCACSTCVLVGVLAIKLCALACLYVRRRSAL